MSQSINVKYLSPTDYRPARVKAVTTSGISKTIAWDYDLDTTENLREVALTLAEDLGWYGKYVGGGTKEGMCFVNTRFLLKSEQFKVGNEKD